MEKRYEVRFLGFGKRPEEVVLQLRALDGVRIIRDCSVKSVIIEIQAKSSESVHAVLTSGCWQVKETEIWDPIPIWSTHLGLQGHHEEPAP